MRVTLFGIDLEIDETAPDWDARTVRERIAEYERGGRSTFDAAVDVPGGLTGLAMRVVRRIPFGETRTHDEVAEELEAAAVAVGQAHGRNPAPIVVPCYRVVGADGLGGFSASGDRGLELKRRLLDHVAARRVDESPPAQARLG